MESERVRSHGGGVSDVWAGWGGVGGEGRGFGGAPPRQSDYQARQASEGKTEDPPIGIDSNIMRAIFGWTLKQEREGGSRLNAPSAGGGIRKRDSGGIPAANSLDLPCSAFFAPCSADLIPCSIG